MILARLGVSVEPELFDIYYLVFAICYLEHNRKSQISNLK